MTEEEYLDVVEPQYDEHGDYEPFYVGFVPLEEEFQETEEAEYDVV